ncbi:MAG: ACT domain-containing protein [Isosphaeraceae bacterium]
MEFVHEITAYLENKPGRLAKICSALAHEKINIQALCVMDTPDRSVLRLVTGDLEPTRKVLTGLGTESEHREVLAVEMENRPGALAKVLEKLAEEHINIEYAYVAPGAAAGKSLGIFHMSNPKRGLQILTDSANGQDRGNAGRRPLHSR